MKNSKFSVSRSQYKKLPQDHLGSFASGVVTLMRDNPSYENLKSFIDELDVKSKNFNLALQSLTDRSPSRTAQKNTAQRDLLTALDNVARSLDIYTPVNDTDYIIGAGFHIREPRTQRRTSLRPITDLMVESKAKGEVTISFENPDRQVVRASAVEWTDDNGVTFKNGLYMTTKKESFKQPSGVKMGFRIANIGARGIKSTWSPVVYVDVL